MIHITHMLEAFWLGNKCLSSTCICIRKYHLGLSTPFSSNQPSQANSYLQTHYPVIVPHSSSSWLSFKHVLTLLLSRLLSTHWVLFPSEVPFAFFFFVTGSLTAPADPPASTCLWELSHLTRHIRYPSLYSTNINWCPLPSIQEA